MAKRTGLGRGLGEIFNEITSAYENELPTETDMKDIPLVEINVNPYQPRRVFNESNIKELASSIKYHGLLQPIIVSKSMDEYILIAGERRLRACKMANMTHIKAIIADVEASKFHELALIENIQREDLNPIELAHSFSALLQEHKLTHEILSQRVRKSRAYISNILRLLSLGSIAQEALINKKITQGHAKVLIGLETKEEELMIDSIIGQKLSVRDVEQTIKKFKQKSKFLSHDQSKKRTSLNFEKLKMKLKQKGISMQIKINKCIFSFKNQEEIDDFVEII